MNEDLNFAIGLIELTEADRSRAGGKAMALGRLAKTGVPVPPGLCLTATLYDDYVDRTGIRQRLPLLLERKAFGDMRWEELWDLGLRVRHLFLETPIPDRLAARLARFLEARFADRPVTVRSSSPAEDSATASFAGLHDSFVNVQGQRAILDRLRLVWASLWSDRALLYRQELGLDPAASTMAVIVQELVVGDCSGVAFSRCPGRPELAVIEAVWGLNQGLVDGDVEPDRYLLDKRGRIVERYVPERKHFCRAVREGVDLQLLPVDRQDVPPLSDDAAVRVFSLLRRVDECFGTPQDLEWTMRGGELFALQARPITTGSGEGGTDRAWYLSLHKSLAALQGLRQTIEDELLPAMERDAERLQKVDPTELSDESLAVVIRERAAAVTEWQDRYREICIPMAHGIRLFGQLYNDRLRPADPFAFLELLASSERLVAVQRNRALIDLAGLLRDDPRLAARLRGGDLPSPESLFYQKLKRFTAEFGDLSAVLGAPGESFGKWVDLLFELSRTPVAGRASAPRNVDEGDYLAAFAVDEQPFAREVLEIGRAAYRLRDNDNLFIGRLVSLLEAAQWEAGRRRGERNNEKPSAENLATRRSRDLDRPTGTRRYARQIVGQPAGPGLAQGLARVVLCGTDLRAFRTGEILVCDAVDPNMTFVAPLAGGIVERRGGMLIHGAIIAREYGIPCVTGVPAATERIKTGDRVTVDGYLGQVTIERTGD